MTYGLFELFINYSVLLSMRCISEWIKVGDTLLYSSPLSSYNPSYFFYFYVQGRIYFANTDVNYNIELLLHTILT